MNWRLAVPLIVCGLGIMLWRPWANDSQQRRGSIAPNAAGQLNGALQHAELVPSQEPEREDPTVEQKQRSSKDSISWRAGPSTGQLPGLALESARLPGIHRWQVDTRLPRGPIRRLAWNAAESTLACFSDDGSVRLYERKPSQLNLVRLIPVNGSSTPESRTLEWDPEGACLLAGDSHVRCELDLWHPGTGT